MKLFLCNCVASLQQANFSCMLAVCRLQSSSTSRRIQFLHMASLLHYAKFKWRIRRYYNDEISVISSANSLTSTSITSCEGEAAEAIAVKNSETFSTENKTYDWYNLISIDLENKLENNIGRTSPRGYKQLAVYEQHRRSENSEKNYTRDR